MTFTKLHGCGNDYLFVDCLERPLEEAGAVARAVCDRRRAIGADGIICIYPSDKADVRMEIYNADGSRAEMCGNGIRGVAKFVADRGLVTGDRLAVETDAGVRTLELAREGGRVVRVRVDMGMPILEGRKIPVDADGPVIDRPLEVAGRTWTVTCVSMGNPHCVTFDADPELLDLSSIGPAFEHHRFFPARVNTEFVRVDDPRRLTMRVWERGSGETLACGTGACAAVVAGVLTGRCERQVTARLAGGELEIHYREDGTVEMTGPSVEVFTTTVRLERRDGQYHLGS
ncbi:MAG: diaminopimelate epimerase [Candidatus Dadabacteria bacterium]|nr:MAG: diaminopimelate epimerase [Candidatus Dadabacteria bacterium]